jgi:hypothetical protein
MPQLPHARYESFMSNPIQQIGQQKKSSNSMNVTQPAVEIFSQMIGCRRVPQ